MYICICNPFTEKDVDQYLCCKEGKAKVGETYRACSGGETPDCCKCLNTLREKVKDHNHKITVQSLQKDLSKETV